MEEGMALSEAHMEELVENSGSMAGEAGGSRLRQQYHSDVLLAPEADFIVDDHVSAHSGMEVADRLTYLEQRIQMQEDEIQLLKMALADVLKRLNISEEQTAALSKKGPVKAARPASLALSSRTSSNAASSLRKSSSSTLPSTTPTRSPASSVKDSPSGPPGRRTPVSITTTTYRKQQDSKPKEANVSTVGTRRVTHCKVTMQIFLSPLPKRTGSTKMAVDTAMQPSAYPPASGPPPEKVVNLERIKAGAGKSSTVIIPLQQKSPCQSPFSPSNTPSYKNPIKSPSQYFQICY
ncbi:echinoderm microtubule-associated protein-like 1 isoform X1 [Astyanax mexicanus]|uniref:echinoderm microtubule-associated protein-like 1 isoform X1 n=1 Tax=Astyanax mexicanus TaxID=7994 RepID=UPI0020CB064F|nr:echinoderm microtubule-associated protein-like 1 isoform X1 [Astyanax mexicanus]